MAPEPPTRDLTPRETPRPRRGYHPLRVAEVRQETPDTRSFVFEVPDDARDLFAYRAGQFCTFRLRIGDEQQLRCYSMSSAPETDERLTVTVKRVPGGVVSNWLHDHVAPGDVVEASQPAGVFCLHERDVPLIAFCGGSGVTPVMSITKSALATTGRPVTVLYANRDRPSVIFHDDMARLQDAHPGRLRVHHHLDSDRGIVDAATVAAVVDGALDADFYVCGPGPFMDLVEATLLGLGVSPDRIALERFVTTGQPVPEPADDSTTTDGPTTDGTTDAGAAGGAGADGGAGDDTPSEVTLILKGKRHQVRYAPGDTVLETARRAGLQAPFSCEAGNCATCMAFVHDGSATMRVNDALTPEEVAEGWVLTCQALPHGKSVTVEYESF
jgi:3-ketosteroid 9alpha-monooxygenase subunit B